MARVPLSEYRAKKLFIPEYRGVTLRMSSLSDDIAKLDNATSYVIKVDQGVKKRGKQGLLRLDVTQATAEDAVNELASKGFERFIAEPMITHDDVEEQYLSIERVRTGVKFLHSPRGGVDVEDQSEAITAHTAIEDVLLPTDWLQRIVAIMDRQHVSFIEINPLLVRDNDCILLDAAVLVDSAASALATDWSDDDMVEATQKSLGELTVAELNERSPASFSLRLLNPDGAIWLLLSGGGASITIADEAANQGKADLIGNYGEYSGGPTWEETQLYTAAVLEQLLESTAPQKTLVIAGGVANFTNVKKTFAGIIDALNEKLSHLQAQHVKVYVRRGGPNETEGLAHMKSFLTQHNLFGSVHGSDTVLTTVVDEALEYIDA